MILIQLLYQGVAIMKPEKKFVARRQELFSQITELIEKKGYANLTVRGICHDIGISTGSFYHYFPEKNDLARILFSNIDNHFSNKVVIEFKDNEPENLITYCTAYARYVMNWGVETCRCISVAPLNNINHNYLDENRSLFQILYNILIRGVDKKQFNLTIGPLETSRMLMVLIRGYSFDWAKRNGNYDLVEKIETFIRLFSKGIVY